MIPVLEPSIEVRLIKTSRRKELVPSTNVARRYSELRSLDITEYLADSAPVHIFKSVDNVAGAFSFSLVDKMLPEFGESLYAMIEPMDIIEIRMAHAPSSYEDRIPVVMRGFVGMIRRSRSMSGGKPQRTVMVAGNDYGKILQILRIYYLNNSAVGDNIVAEMKFFHKYADEGGAKIMPAASFASLVLDKVINPYVARLTKDASGKRVSAEVINSIKVETTIPGTVSPFVVSNAIDCSVEQLLASVFDVGAFNEMFIDDRDGEVVLVIRPNPYKDVAHKGILRKADGEFPLTDTIPIDASEIESIDESRSDRGVANYFWVSNTSWQLMANETSKLLADASPAKEYVYLDYVNTDAGRYGFRKMEVSSMLGPDDMLHSDATPKSEMKTEEDKLTRWLTGRRRDLALLNKDNAIFESGSMRLMGNERIKAGMYLRVDNGGIRSFYYVTSVKHEFIPFVGFKTVLNFERGTGFIDRAKMSVSPYLSELIEKGVA